MLNDLASVLPTLDAVGLIVAYVAVVGLLLSLNLYSSWHWAVKTGANLAAFALFVVTYHSWPGVLGWPTERDLPRQFYLHAVNVDEPARIYLWGTDLERGLGRNVPRAFSIPYSTRLHEQVDQVGRKLRKGLPVVGQVVPNDATEVDLSSFDQANVSDSSIVFVDAPADLLPTKP